MVMHKNDKIVYWDITKIDSKIIFCFYKSKFIILQNTIASLGKLSNSNTNDERSNDNFTDM